MKYGIGGPDGPLPPPIAEAEQNLTALVIGNRSGTPGYFGRQAADAAKWNWFQGTSFTERMMLARMTPAEVDAAFDVYLSMTALAGMCQCGCGGSAAIAKVNDRTKGWIKGQPLKFLKGHNMKSQGLRNHEAARGNTGINSNGYVRVNVGPNQREYEHVLMGEAILGRRLRFYGIGDPRNEEVHHVNGVPGDNRNENFVICTRAYHRELHYRLEQSPAWPEFQARNTHPETA